MQYPISNIDLGTRKTKTDGYIPSLIRRKNGYSKRSQGPKQGSRQAYV